MALKAVVDSLDEIDEKFHELYEEREGKFYLKRIEGLVTSADVTRVQTALTNEKNAHKATKTKLASFGELDPEETRAALDRIPELEAAAEGKLDEGKLTQMVEGRLRAKVAPIERERDRLRQENTALQGEIEGFKASDRSRRIGDSVLKAAQKMKVRVEAHDDVIAAADRIFELDDTGTVVAKDNVGVTPGVSPEVWLTDIQSKKPHWWGESVGGGASGGQGRTNTGENPWKRDSWNVTKQGQIIRQDPRKAEQLAKAAGTKVGGARPSK